MNDIDRLGRIRAEISNLQEEEKRIAKRIREALEAAPADNQVIEGQLFSARLVTQMRETLIAEKVREYLSPQQLYHATRVTPVTFVKLAPRTVEAAVVPHA